MQALRDRADCKRVSAMSRRDPDDPVETAIEQHLRAAAALLAGRRGAGGDDVIARLDLILTRLASTEKYPVTWVKLDKYIELTGDSMDSVQSRRQVGKWLDGVQCKIVNGRLWINLRAVEEWIEKWDQTKPARAALNYGKEPKAKRPG